MSASHRLTSENALRFMLAGNATVTVVDANAEQRFTYKVQAPRDQNDQRPIYFVKVLTGPENTRDYSYMGMISERTWLRTTARSRVTADAPSFKLLRRVLDGLGRNWPLPDGVEVWHEGKCGRCGRALTVPESIERGIGPECAQYAA